MTMLLGLVISGCADRGQIVSIVASATEVLPGAGSPADKAGLLPGDRIISLEGRRVSTPEGLTNHLQRYDVGERVSLTIRRGSRVQTIEVELGVRPGGL